MLSCTLETDIWQVGSAQVPPQMSVQPHPGMPEPYSPPPPYTAHSQHTHADKKRHSLSSFLTALRPGKRKSNKRKEKSMSADMAGSPNWPVAIEANNMSAPINEGSYRTGSVDDLLDSRWIVQSPHQSPYSQPHSLQSPPQSPNSAPHSPPSSPHSPQSPPHSPERGIPPHSLPIRYGYPNYQGSREVVDPTMAQPYSVHNCYDKPWLPSPDDPTLPWWHSHNPEDLYTSPQYTVAHLLSDNTNTIHASQQFGSDPYMGRLEQQLWGDYELAGKPTHTMQYTSYPTQRTACTTLISLICCSMF